MSTSATGSVVKPDGTDWVGLRVRLYDDAALFDAELGGELTGADGHFTITYVDAQTRVPATGELLGFHPAQARRGPDTNSLLLRRPARPHPS